VAEGAGDGFLDDHLAELAHDQEGDEAGDGVAEDHRRTGGFQHPGRAEEQTGADGSAEGDQLDMTILQAALQLAGGGLGLGHGRGRLGGEGERAAMVALLSSWAAEWTFPHSVPLPEGEGTDRGML